MNTRLMSQLSFMNPNRIEGNIDAVLSFCGSQPAGNGFTALASIQGFPTDCFTSEERHQLVKEDQVDVLRSTIKGLMGGEFPVSFRTIGKTHFERYSEYARSGESMWSALFPADFVSYQKLIRRVIYAYRDEYSGGSVSNRIGWIWLSPDTSWDEAEFCENLVHEYVHNVLFLEEMVGTLFSVSAAIMAEPQNQVVSAIRRVPRYFDQTYHAAAVAIVLTELALAQGHVEKARVLTEGLLPSLDAMKNKSDLMTENGFSLLREMIKVSIDLYHGSHQELAAA